MAHRIAIIGGGSTVFIPQFLKLFMATPTFAGSTIVLMDIDAQRLELMDSVARKLVAEKEASLRIQSTLDRRGALKEADFVIMVAPIGGFEMREVDLEIPARYGIYTLGGETVGPAGMMRAFRHIPVMVEICHELEEISPKAWLLSYCNPTTPLLMAMERVSDLKKACLCTCSAILQRPHRLGELAGVTAEDLSWPPLVGGLNHCAMILELHLKDGRDALPLISERIDDVIAKEFLDRYDILPYCTGHWAEFYLRHSRLDEAYQGRIQGLRMNYGWKVRDMSEDRTRAKDWEQAAKTWLEGRGGQENLLESVLPPSEGIQVVDIIEAILENKNEVHAAIVPNRGGISNLPHDAVVEISCLVSNNSIRPIQVGSLPSPIAINLRRYIDFYEIVVEAGMTGDRKLALEALLIDPRTSAVLTLTETEKLLSDLMEAEAAFLPQFDQ